MRLFNRQKVLLATINELNKRNIFSRRAIVKSQFLLEKEYNLGDSIKFYHFFPYKQGPFSQLCFYDLRLLKKEGLVTNTETRLTKKGQNVLTVTGNQFNHKIIHLLDRFSDEKQMTDYVYKKYPEFTVKSELIEQKPQNKAHGVFTIGYEGKDIDTFLNLLIQNKIDLVIDVRKNPFSMNFCYIKSNLKRYLESVGIEYLHIPELGIESEDRKELETREDYEKLFEEYRKKLPLKEVYLNRIMELGLKKCVVLLCYEADPSYCHRGQIAKAIRKKKVEVTDI